MSASTLPLDTDAMHPEADSFSQLYNAGQAQLVFARIVSDLETPVSAYLKLCGEKPDSFLLESVEGGKVLGRHSIIGCDPDIIWQVDTHSDGINRAQINRNALHDRTRFVHDDRPMMESFQALIDESALEVPLDLAPMAAGVFGYFGYDTVRETEHLPNRPGGGLDIPTAIFIRPTIVVVFDNILQELIFATPVRPTNTVCASTAYTKAKQKLETAIAKLRAPVEDTAIITRNTDIAVPVPSSNTSKAEFFDMVEKARDYISAGDIFQVVLSQQFSTPFDKSPFSLYRSLRRENPSPFLFFLNYPDHALIGSSPEFLVRVKDSTVTIRPLAGTRPRGKTPAEDLAMERDLLADPKERAEHLMLLDLGRNDAGRHAKMGSVHPTDQFFIERYSHVMHIASNVTSQLKQDARPLDAVMAGFPAGTVSGAPKVRAMEIIDELEKAGRAHYAGAIGYFSANGSVDTAITLRTGVVKDSTLHVQAGAGLVADSDPQSEYDECINKARALFSAAAKAR